MRARKVNRMARWAVRRAAYHVQRGLERPIGNLASRVRVLAKALTGGGKRRGLFVLAAGPEVGALPDDVRQAVGDAIEKNVPVELLVLDPAWDVPAAGWPADVPTYRFWRDAAPGGGGFRSVASVDGLAAGPVMLLDGSWLPGYYREGLPVLATTMKPGGTWLDHFGSFGYPARRDELDPDGGLVRVLDFHPTGPRAVTHRYFDADGSCWLSARIESDGSPGPAQRHRPRPVEYAGLAAVQAEWVASRIAATWRPVVLSAGTASNRIAVEVRRRRRILATSRA